jgi:shikimate dehydrogenase
VTERVGLLGWPVSHSVSPAMHQAAFAALGLDWRYDLLPVPPDDFEREVARRIAEGYRGFNVTIPHKDAARRLPQVSALSPAAEAIGAVNTLIVQPDGSLHGDNTDWQGFLDALADEGIETTNAVCLVLGTGGSGRAVRYALEHAGAKSVTQVSRHAQGAFGVTGYDDLARLTLDLDVVVNCTPVGMHPNPDASPWPGGLPFPPGAVLFDLVYNPPVTLLMQEAQSAGAQSFGGLGMLVRQGARSFALWTGHTPPLDVMESAAQRALAGSA